MNEKMDIHSIGFRNANDLRRASPLLVQAYLKVETLFGRERAKTVRMMRCDRSLRWIIEACPGCGEYLIRFFVEFLKEALEPETFEVEVLKAEACAPK